MARPCASVLDQALMLVLLALLAVFAASSTSDAQTLPPNAAMSPQLAKKAYFAATSDGRELHLFPIQESNPLTCIDVKVPFDDLKDDELITALAIEHSNRYVAIGTNTGNLTIDFLPDANVPHNSTSPLDVATKIEIKGYHGALPVTAVAFQPDNDRKLVQKLIVAFWDADKNRGHLRLYDLSEQSDKVTHELVEVPDILTEGRVDAITFTGVTWSGYSFRETVGANSIYKQIDEHGFSHPVDAPAGPEPQYKGQIVASADGSLFTAMATDAVTGKTEIAVWNAATGGFLNYIDISGDAPSMPLAFSIAAKPESPTGLTLKAASQDDSPVKTGDICLFSFSTSSLKQPRVNQISSPKMPNLSFDPKRIADYEAFLSECENDKADPRMAESETAEFLNRAQQLLEENASVIDGFANRNTRFAQARLDELVIIKDLKKQSDEAGAKFSADAHSLRDMIGGARLNSQNPDWAAMDGLKRSLTASFDRKNLGSLWSKAKDAVSRSSAFVEFAGGRSDLASDGNSGAAGIAGAPSISGRKTADTTPVSDGVSALHLVLIHAPEIDSRGRLRVVTATRDYVAAITGDQLRLWKFDRDDSAIPLPSIQEVRGSQVDPEEYWGLTWIAGKSGSDAGLYVTGNGGTIRQYNQSDFGRKPRVPSSIVHPFGLEHVTALAVPHGGTGDLFLAGTTMDQQIGEAKIVNVATDGAIPDTVTALNMNDHSSNTVITTADFSPDNKLVAVGAYMGRIAVFDVAQGTDAAHNTASRTAASSPRYSIEPEEAGGERNILYALRFLNDHELIWCREDGYLYDADLPQKDAGATIRPTRLTSQPCDSKGLQCVAFSDENNGERLVAAGGGSGKIYFWRVHSGSAQPKFTQKADTFETQVGSVRSLAFVPGRNVLIVGGTTGAVEMYHYILK